MNLVDNTASPLRLPDGQNNDGLHSIANQFEVH